ncbi:MAG TPA: winged helix-turn-helix domain-containing protein [Rhizomicrobium sp.]|jgi:TolB-like protein|nr:winged helix-turn-helix domain-containing protein [Rhizomicrobium sp.]
MLNPAGPTALAQESDFTLGRLSVSPSRLEVCAGERRETIQPRVMQVLTLLARRRGEVISRDDLIAICWGGRSVSEDAINRSIAGVRRLAESSGEFLIETVRRVGYRLEQTASPVGAAPVVPPSSNNAVLAVLAFDNLSGEADMAYFSDGISEEILQTLARGTGLNVIGRSSSFQFRGPEKAAARIASVLKATHVLDGSVRRSGNRVRIATNLIDCRSETTLWADHFERELSDVFALQDEIASSVATALRITFAPASRHNAIDPAADSLNPEAYSAYLQGLFFLNRRNNKGDMHRAAGFFTEGVALEPNYADAHAGLALTYAILAVNGQSRESLPLAKSEAATALRLAPDNFAALAASADIAFGSWEWSAAHSAYVHLLARYPNSADARHYLGIYMTALHLPERCLAEHRRAVSLDPLSALNRGNIGDSLHYLCRDEEAIPEFRKALALDPNMAFVLSGLCASFVGAGRLQEAKAMRQRLVAADGEDGFYTMRCDALIASREPDGAAQLVSLARRAEHGYTAGSVNAALVGLIYALAGEFDVALEWFQRSINDHDLRFFQNTAEPLLPAVLKSDPRWHAFMEQPMLREWRLIRARIIAHGKNDRAD